MLIESPFEKTYEKKCIRHWIHIGGEHVREPIIGCILQSPQNKIEFSDGFPQWIYEFIENTRPHLDLYKQTMQKKIIENKLKEPLNKKTKTALLRQQFYDNHLFSPTIKNENNVDDNQDSKLRHPRERGGDGLFCDEPMLYHAQNLLRQ
jgi:hypothetical protein